MDNENPDIAGDLIAKAQKRLNDLSKELNTFNKDLSSKMSKIIESQKDQVENESEIIKLQKIKSSLAEEGNLLIQSYNTAKRDQIGLEQLKTKILKKEAELRDLVEKKKKAELDGSVNLYEITRDHKDLDQEIVDLKAREAAATDKNIKNYENQIEKLTEISALLETQEKFQNLTKEKADALKGSFGNIVPVVEEIFGLLKLIGTNPLALILSLLVLTVKRFIELDSAAEELSKTTGLLQSQTDDLKKNIESLSKEYAKFGVSATDVVKAQSALLESTNGNQFAVAETTKSVVLMSNRLGIAEEDSAQMLQTFQGMSGVSSQTATALAYQTAELAKQSGLAPRKIFQDISKSSEATLKYMRGNTTQLIKASIEARKFGTSLSAVAGAADSLLDFETSINKEAELSALLGKNVNLQKMRQLAYDSDLGGLAKEQSNFLREQGGFLGKNVFQQKAMAEAMGVTLEEANKISQQNAIQDDMVRQLNEARASGDLKKVEMIEKIQAKEKAAADKLANLKNKENKFDAESYEAQIEKERIAGEMVTMQQELNSLLVSLSSILLPIVKLLVPVAKILSSLTLKAAENLGKIENLLNTIMGSSEGLESRFKKFVEAMASGVFVFMQFKIGFEYLSKYLNMLDNLSKHTNKGMRALGMTLRIATNGFGEILNLMKKGFDIIGMWISKLDRVKSTVIKVEEVISKFSTWGEKATKNFNTFGSLVKDIFVTFNKSSSILEPIFGFFKKFAPLIKTVGTLASKFFLVITIIQGIWSAFSRLYEIAQTFGSGDFLGGVMKLATIFPSIIYDVMVKPFLELFNMVGKWFGIDLGETVTNGLKSIYNLLGDGLKAPFANFINWFDKDSGLPGKSPSKLGLSIVDGLKSVIGMIFDVLTSPFKMVWDFIGDLFGVNNLGSMIVDTFKKIAPMIFDFLISPFSMLLKFIPDFLKPKSSEKLVSNTQPNENVQQLNNNTVQSSPTNVEVTSKVNTNDQLIGVLNQLSELLKNGITVEMDGEKVTRIITNRVVSQNM